MVLPGIGTTRRDSLKLQPYLLIDLVLRERGITYPVDEMVYPVCFNMRHSVELRLKGAIEELVIIEKYRGRDLQFDLAGSHDIGIIWNFFAETARDVDDRYEPILCGLDRGIADIAEIDATGQTFRYPSNTDSQKHLVDVAIINFEILKARFAELESALDHLHRLNRYLREEYGWGSFTKRLSRKNLFEIASILPLKSNWSNGSFDDAKIIIKKTFGIGSRELSESIDRIKAHFELAPEIGVHIPLRGIEESDLKDFFCFWFKKHNIPSDKVPLVVTASALSLGDIREEFEKNSEIRAEVWGAVKQDLTPEKLAGLSALFYFARDLNFSECYASIYDMDLQEAQAAFANSADSVKKLYFHIFDKTNAIYNILRSLYFLRKTELADRLVAEYSLGEKFSWLDEARSRTLFRKPDYCGYVI